MCYELRVRMSWLRSNHYYDHDEARRNSFVIDTCYYESNMDYARFKETIETDRYINEYYYTDHAYTYFNLLKKTRRGNHLLITYQVMNLTVLTPEIVNKLGDFIDNLQRRIGVKLAGNLPVICPGARVIDTGLRLINRRIDKMYV